jgi:hypothetical protein
MLEGIGAIGGAFLIATAAGSAFAKPSQKGRRRTARQGRHAIAPSVVAAFAQNPNGGPGLTAALQALLIQEPGLAADVVDEALAEARQAFSQAGNQQAANQIGGATAFADPRTTAFLRNASGYVVAGDNDSGRGRPANGGFGGSGGSGVGGGGGGGFAPRLSRALTRQTRNNQEAVDQTFGEALVQI